MTTQTEALRQGNITTEASTQVDVVEFTVVRTAIASIPWVGTQKLDRTLGTPRPLGEGARRAVSDYGEALERLAE